MRSNHERTCLVLNQIAVFMLMIVLVIAFAFQFGDHEVPCPLCLLQRVGFVLMGFALMMNLRFGLKASHYMLGVAGALVALLSSLRQVLLHIVPGSGTYGGAIFTWHLYTWSFVASFLFLCVSCVALCWQSYLGRTVRVSRSKGYRALFYVLCVFFLTLCVVNFVSTYMECGLTYCPSDPISYPHRLFW